MFQIKEVKKRKVLCETVPEAFAYPDDTAQCHLVEMDSSFDADYQNKGSELAESGDMEVLSCHMSNHS